MAGIWINSSDDAAGWELGAPSPFPDEATLHRLIAENPQLLPLAGSPQLTVLGSEVQLGVGYADILAVEPSGRPAIIEVKLARNPEARRSVVAQVLAYAAFLQGSSVDDLEQIYLQTHLSNAGYVSILEAVQANDQDEMVEADSFSTRLQEFLNQGKFRLVLVLDDTSDELERIIAYLDTMTTQALTIDLITLSVYEVNGAQVALPQPVVPDFNAAKDQSEPGGAEPTTRNRKPVRSDGSGAFRNSVADASGDNRKTFDMLIKWAEQVAELPNVRLVSTIGVENTTLRHKIQPGNSGLVTIGSAKDKQTPWLWPSANVFKRLAPNSIELVERATGKPILGQGSTVYDITPEVLDALTAAYREAVGADD